MIVWINGACGAGKTSAARALLDLIPGSVLFDPETVGEGLREVLPERRYGQVTDVQDISAWRRLVVDTAAALLDEVPGPLVAPMALLRQEYRDEIFGNLASRRIQVHHVLLHSDETILQERSSRCRHLSGDAEANAAHLDAYRAALSWLTEDACLVDNGKLGPEDVARRIAELVMEGSAVRDIVQTPKPSTATLASGVLLFDEEDRILLVDPTYKPGWEFPGGVVEPGEAPSSGGLREVAEELGVELSGQPRLLVADWEPPTPPGFGGVRLLFDGGVLDAAQRPHLRLPGDELREWRFFTEAEAAERLPPVRRARLHWALRARERATVLYLEGGEPIGSG